MICSVRLWHVYLYICLLYLIVAQSLSHVPLFASPWPAAQQVSLSFTILWSLLKLISTEAVMPPNYLILCHPLLLLLSIFPNIRFFSSKSALRLRWPKYCNFRFSIGSSMNIQGWFPLELTSLISAFQGTLKSFSPPQFKSINSLVLSLLCGPILTFVCDYLTTGKTIALNTGPFVGKVMSLLLNTLSGFVITFLPRNKYLLISWLKVTVCSHFGAQGWGGEICYYFHFFPIYLPWSDGTRCHDLSFLNVELSQFFHFPLSPSSRGSLVPSLSAFRVVSSAYQSLWMFLLATLIPACDSSSSAFHMRYSAYKLNNQSDHTQP